MKIRNKDIGKYAVVDNSGKYILGKIVSVGGYKGLDDDLMVTLTRELSCGIIDTFVTHEKYILFKFFEQGLKIEQ